MLELFFLRFTDPRLAAALRPLPAAGRALGDLALAPAGATARLLPLGAAAAAAGRLRGTPASSAAAAAAEEFFALLGNFFAGLVLHGAVPDAAAVSALARLEAACSALATPRAGAARAAALCAAGRDALRPLLRGAHAPRGGGFSENLKYSSMYSDLDGAFAALERCALAARGA